MLKAEEGESCIMWTLACVITLVGIVGTFVFWTISKAVAECNEEKWRKYVIEKYNSFLSKNKLIIPDDKIILQYAVDYKDICIWKGNNAIIYICSSLEYIIKHRFIFANDNELDDFIANDNLNIFFKQLVIDNILFYKVEGEIITSTYTTGGTVKGGGSSLTGAIVGGALAGDVGAIIGSRKKSKSNQYQLIRNMMTKELSIFIYMKAIRSKSSNTHTNCMTHSRS